MGMHRIPSEEQRCTAIMGVDDGSKATRQYHRHRLLEPPTHLPIRCKRLAGADGLCWQHRKKTTN